MMGWGWGLVIGGWGSIVQWTCSSDFICFFGAECASRIAPAFLSDTFTLISGTFSSSRAVL